MATADDLERLTRWEDAGGTWRVALRRAASVGSPASITLALCRCDGGEEVDRFTSADPRLAAYVGDRASSEPA